MSKHTERLERLKKGDTRWTHRENELLEQLIGSRTEWTHSRRVSASGRPLWEGTEMAKLKWEFHHPMATEYHVGYIGTSLDDANPKSVREQITDLYKFGGWQPMSTKDVRLDVERRTYKYPGDPTQRAIASTRLRGETILVFPSDIWVIVQPDGSFETARLD